MMSARRRMGVPINIEPMKVISFKCFPFQAERVTPCLDICVYYIHYRHSFHDSTRMIQILNPYHLLALLVGTDFEHDESLLIRNQHPSETLGQIYRKAYH